LASPSSLSSYGSSSSISAPLTPGSLACDSIPSRFSRARGHGDDGGKWPGHEEPLTSSSSIREWTTHKGREEDGQ
jgi:hypothetical protein